jgi:hypothetical protein
MTPTFHCLIKAPWLGCLALVGLWGMNVGIAHAQDAIYRCGSTYTNNPTPAEKKECRLIEGGNITIISAPKTKPVASGTKVAMNTSPNNGDQPRVDPAQQRARDSDAKAILEAELKRAEARVLDLQREYNNGNPERKGDEARNHGKYVERVSELKAALLRAEADVIGIRRELQRLGVTPPPSSPASIPTVSNTAATLPVLSAPVPSLVAR